MRKFSEINLSHPCKNTCSGWKAGYDAGRRLNGKTFLESNKQLLLEAIDALKFYASPDSYDTDGCVGLTIGSLDEHDFEPDFGERAKQALQKIQDMEGGNNGN